MASAGRELDAETQRFISSQRLFFVATAPLAANGHVNVSPKGLDSFRILGPGAVAYLDFVGHGAETMAHVRENGRIVFMFCAFEGKPQIVRVHGRGRVLEPGDAGFTEVRQHFPSAGGVRSIIAAEVTRVARSCGFGVPLFEFSQDRAELPRWVEQKGPQKLEEYQRQHNTASIDGLPGVTGLDK